jgi:hypothetical protein
MDEQQKKPTYKTVPLDEETHQRLLALCNAYGMGRRSQGALMTRLINQEYRKLTDVKLDGQTATPEYQPIQE